MQEAHAPDIVSNIEPLDLEDDELVESAILIVKTSVGDGTSRLQHAVTPGLSHWEMLGMTLDTLDGLRGTGDWE